MTRFMFVLMVMCSTFSGFAQKANTVKLSPPVRDVIIYLSGAQIRYSVEVNLTEGRNLLVFDQLATGLSPASVRITAGENITVLSSSHKLIASSPEASLAALNRISDSVKLITKKIKGIEDEIDAWQTQKNLLLKNMEMGGENTGVNFLDLQKAADYYQVRILEINRQLSDLQGRADVLSDLNAQLSVRLAKAQAEAATSNSQLSILVIAKSAGHSSIEFSYVVKDAGWMPYYDLKCDDISKPITFVYRAKAYNLSGIDWTHVPLTLSTADPGLDISVPEISTWYLSTYYNRSGFAGNNLNKDELNQEMNQYEAGQEQTKGQSPQVKYKQIEVPELSFQFNIRDRYTIPTDGQPYIVDIEEKQVNATFRYISVPSVEKTAFLMACIKDWEELNLVEGNANIYLGGTYVGQSYVNPNSISDTLQISLGRDSRIQVERVKLKEFSSRQLIGTKRKATYVYEISVKNNRSSAIAIDILDQVPVSNNQEIEVTVDQTTGAELTPLTGMLKWTFNIEPGQTQTVKMGYTVKYPKTMNLQFKKTRSINCPSF